MEFERRSTVRTAAKPIELSESNSPSPLVVLRDTERSLRQTAVEVLTPILPAPLAASLGEKSLVADESLDVLATIDLAAISDAELKPARIKMGLLFVGFGALAMALLLLYLDTLHPNLSTIEQIRQYWYQYIWFVSLGIAGMFMLGREAMRAAIAADEGDRSEW